MEPKLAGQNDPNRGTGTGTGTPGTTHTESGMNRPRQEQQRSEGRMASDFVEQTRQSVSEAYDRTNRTLNDTYEKAMDYGRENPGSMTLIAFGAGIGVGILLASAYSPRTRAGRIVPPVMNALSNLAQELIR